MPTYGDWQTDKTITVYQHSWECLPETRARQCRRCGRLWTYHTPGPPLHGCTGPLEEAARKIIEQSDRMMDQMTAEALMDESKRVFGTGAQRDTAQGKPRPDLISPFALERWGAHMAKGAAHYGDRNWEKGMPLSVFLESLMRHTLSVMQGKDDEDHLAAILFNAGAMIHGQEMIRRGIWPAEYADLQTYEEDAG